MTESQTPGTGESPAVSPPSEAYEELLNAVPDAVVVTASDGRVVLCNRQAELLFGYSREDLIGMSVELLLPERFRGRHVGHRETYQAAPRVRPMGVGLDLYALRSDGVEIPVEISLSPSTMGAQDVVIGSIRDVTARKQLEAERAMALHELQAIQTVTDTALSSLSAEDLLPDLLRRVRSVLGADTASILLMDASGEYLVPRASLGLEDGVADVRVPLGAGFAGRIAAARRPIAVDDAGGIELVNSILRSSGVRSLLGAPLLIEGRVAGVLHVGTLAPRHFTAEETNLLQLVADRAALAIDRSRLYDEAQEAVRIRNEFLSAISHDLGNPVAAIRIESRQLRQAAANAIGRAAELLEGLAQIETTATRMWRQVEELLDLARLQVGHALELNWRAIDLVALVRELAAVQQATTSQHQVVLELELPQLMGEWDSTRIERVVTNLLSNAVKYSPEGGQVVVRLTREPDERAHGEVAVLQVIDRGIGIPATDLPHIFERFHRASNARGRFAGTGIGLAGALQIVELHGGEITVESEEGSGTTVTVRLPLEEVPSSEAAAALYPTQTD